jgi:CPA1 family monovalent cation:H+ antiporter
VGSGLLISWAGMRGIVTLAAALALPPAFPYRGLVVLTAFAVVLGTLVIHGLTLKPLLRWLELRDGDPISHEVDVARDRALQAALGSFARDHSPLAEAVRRIFTARLSTCTTASDGGESERCRHLALHRDALQAARAAVFAMRERDEIGDDAYHRMEEDLDWLEMAGEGGD